MREGENEEGTSEGERCYSFSHRETVEIRQLRFDRRVTCEQRVNQRRHTGGTTQSSVTRSPSYSLLLSRLFHHWGIIIRADGSVCMRLSIFGDAGRKRGRRREERALDISSSRHEE